MKNYISPYQLFDLPIDSTPLDIESKKVYFLDRLKHDNVADKVQIYGTKLEKGRVLQLLAELENYQTRQFHQEIYKDKSLLNFLEFGHLNYFKNKRYNSLSDAEFIKFIGPYFGYQYSETLTQAIKTQDSETLTLLSMESLPMLENFEEFCFYNANSFVNETIKELKELQRKEELLYMSERELVSYLPNKTIELYNMLPDYFSSARNLIGNEIYSLSVVLLQNYGRSDGASAMLQQGLKLKLDKPVRSNLESMLQKFSFRSKVPAFVWVALAVISLLYIVKYLETFLATL